ncbi:MAG: single-stranded DNA-binding protein [Chloroflexota bacterium]
MYQKVVIVGNLGSDPEMRYTPQGDAVTSFNVATNRRWTGGDGQPGEETTWFRVSAWGRQAESCNQYLAKGRQVLVEGRLTPDRETGGPRVWTTNEGQQRASYELRALTVQFLGGTGGGGRDNGGGQSSAPRSSAPSANAIAEDEIPF